MSLLQLKNNLIFILTTSCTSMASMVPSRLDKNLMNGMEISALAFDVSKVGVTRYSFEKIHFFHIIC